MEASKLPFRIEVAKVDERGIEIAHQNKQPSELSKVLAMAKVEAVQANYPDELIIGADTFAMLPNGTTLHKPSSPKEATALCMAQSGKTITVVTGLAMLYKKKLITDSCSTKISYIDFDQATIDKLLHGDDATIRNSGLGFFSDAPGFTLVESFKGSYTGAMGLPMEIVRKNMTALGYTA